MCANCPTSISRKYVSWTKNGPAKAGPAGPLATALTHTVVDHNEHESNPKRAAALFVLKTREEGRLTQRALNQVVLSATSLCEEVVGNMESEVRKALKGIGLPEADQKTVMTRLASVSRDP